MTEPITNKFSWGVITTQNLLPSLGGTPNPFVPLRPEGFATAVVQVEGTYTGALSAQGTIDGVNFVTANVPIF